MDDWLDVVALASGTFATVFIFTVSVQIIFYQTLHCEPNCTYYSFSDLPWDAVGLPLPILLATGSVFIVMICYFLFPSHRGTVYGLIALLCTLSLVLLFLSTLPSRLTLTSLNLTKRR